MVRGAVAGKVGEHVLQLAGELLHAGRRDDLEADCYGIHLDVHFVVVQVTFAQALAQHLARVAHVAAVVGGRARRRQQHVENALLGSLFGGCLNALHGLLAQHLHGDVGQVAHDRFDIATDVANLGELGGFHLDERRIRQARQAAGDFRLADAGRADHEDVLGRHFLAQTVLQLHAPPAVAQGDGHRALGIVLADDVLIEFVNDLARRHEGHSVSIVALWLV